MQSHFGGHDKKSSWFNFTDSLCTCINLCKIVNGPTCLISYRLTINPDFSWEATLFGNIIQPSNPVLASIDPMLVSLEQVMHLVSVLDSAKICAGNNEGKYVESVKSSETTLAGYAYESTCIN